MPVDAPLPLGFEIQFGRRVRGGWNDPAPDAVTITHNSHVLETNQFICQLRNLEEGEKYTVSQRFSLPLETLSSKKLAMAACISGRARMRLTRCAVRCALVFAAGPRARPQ